MYDAKLRRFLSPDKAKQQYGAYTFCGNNPVSLVDRNGKKFEFPQAQYADKFKAVIEYIRSLGGVFRQKLERLEQSTKVITFEYSANEATSFFRRTYAGIECYYKVIINGKVMVHTFEEGGVHKYSTYGIPTIMVHELLGHAYNYRYHEEATNKRKAIKDSDFDNMEEKDVITNVEHPFIHLLNKQHLEKGEPFIFNTPRFNHQYSKGFIYEVGDWLSSMPKIGGMLVESRAITAEDRLDPVFEKELSADPNSKNRKHRQWPHTVLGTEFNENGELIITTNKTTFKIEGDPANIQLDDFAYFDKQQKVTNASIKMRKTIGDPANIQYDFHFVDQQKVTNTSIKMQKTNFTEELLDEADVIEALTTKIVVNDQKIKTASAKNCLF